MAEDTHVIVLATPAHLNVNKISRQARERGGAGCAALQTR
jgi:hypothetical protein